VLPVEENRHHQANIAKGLSHLAAAVIFRAKLKGEEEKYRNVRGLLVANERVFVNSVLVLDSSVVSDALNGFI
jgi:hypothetical protein